MKVDEKAGYNIGEDDEHIFCYGESKGQYRY